MLENIEETYHMSVAVEENGQIKKDAICSFSFLSVLWISTKKRAECLLCTWRRD